MDSAFKVMTMVITAVALHTVWILGSGDAATCTNECISTLTDPSARILKGVPREAGIFIGQRQSIVIFHNGDCLETNVGVCFDTSRYGCNVTGTNEDDCDNFIRDISSLNETCDLGLSSECRLYFSGNNALRPRSFFCDYTGTAMTCDFYPNTNVSEGNDTCLDDNKDGSHVFQRNRDENATSLYSDGRMLYGVRRSSGVGESQIGVSDIDVSTGILSNPVRTRDDTPKQVNRAQFVGEPFSVGDYTYFLFREPAVEYTSLSYEQTEVEKVFSRIARVCTNDVGVEESGKMIWTSYLKQRLSCYQETEDPDIHRYYDLIQDFVFTSATEPIYAIFTTERNGTASSALCTFNLAEIDATFNAGDFFGTESDSSIWKIYDGTSVVPQPGKNCSNPNTADIRFMRHYSLVKPDAGSVATCTLYDDRLTDIEWEEGDVYIVSSEKGCIYTFNISLPSCTYTMRYCPDSLQNTPIKDIAIVPGSNVSVIATTEDGAFFVDLNATEIIVSPKGTSHTLQANSEFELLVQCPSACNVMVMNGTRSDADYLPEYLHSKTFFDPENTTVQIVVRVLWNTTITFPGNTDCDVTLFPEYEYTTAELEQRLFDWGNHSNTYNEVKTTCTATATLNIIDLTNPDDPLAVRSCDECVWANCSNAS